MALGTYWRWYRTGTIALTNGSATVTGTSTAWINQAYPGDMLLLTSGTNAGTLLEIDAVGSNTSITLATNFTGTTASGLSYAIIRASVKRTWPSDIHAQMAEWMGSVKEVYGGAGAPPAALGSTGAIYIDGAARMFYERGSGGWSSGISMIGPEGPAAGSTSVQVDVYTTPGTTTWTKPAWAKTIDVVCIGGGGGGGAGYMGAAGTVRSGGSGGAGAIKVRATLDASLVGATETVTVGAGGSGGNPDLSGHGTTGGTSSFGSHLLSPGGVNGNSGGTTGAPASVAVGAGAFAGSGAASFANGNSAANLTPAAPAVGGGGGCSAGGITAGNAATNGGQGGSGGVEYTAPGGTAGSTSGTRAGGNGTSVPAGKPYGGGGGGGAASSITAGTNGGDGGSGGLYGAGGGGGGSAVTGTNTAGSGGAGASGIVWVMSRS